MPTYTDILMDKFRGICDEITSGYGEIKYYETEYIPDDFVENLLKSANQYVESFVLSIFQMKSEVLLLPYVPLLSHVQTEINS